MGAVELQGGRGCGEATPANPGLILRPAEPGDVRRIAEFQTACWREAYRGLVPQDYLDRVTVADREVRWRSRLLTGRRQIALALPGAGGREIAGVVSWADTTAADVPGRPADDRPALELTSLYVGAEHRGRGLARALVGHALQDRPAHLWVFDDNTGAQACYARLRFLDDGERSVDPDTGLLQRRLVRR